MNKNQRMEGSFINKSLLTLGTVIHKLRCSAGSVCRAVQGQRGAGAVQDTYIARYCCSLSWGCQQRPVRPPRLMWQQPCVHVSAAGSDPCLSQLLPCSEGKAAHIPFRDSKLTQLLQDSLSGQAKGMVQFYETQFLKLVQQEKWEIQRFEFVQFMLITRKKSANALTWSAVNSTAAKPRKRPGKRRHERPPRKP